MVQFTVNPYTFNEGIFDSQEQQRQQYKTIHTKSSKHQVMMLDIRSDNNPIILLAPVPGGQTAGCGSEAEG